MLTPEKFQREILKGVILMYILPVPTHYAGIQVPTNIKT